MNVQYRRLYALMNTNDPLGMNSFDVLFDLDTKESCDQLTQLIRDITEENFDVAEMISTQDGWDELNKVLADRDLTLQSFLFQDFLVADLRQEIQLQKNNINFWS